MMLTSKLRPISRRVVGSLSTRKVLPSLSVVGTNNNNSKYTSCSTARYISSEQTKKFQELGILDDQGLTIFDTLHEMQINSCQVFSSNELFGTYNEDTKNFQFMTYLDYADKVNQCRSLLKDLGTNI